MPFYNLNGHRRPQCPYCYKGEALYDEHSQTVYCEACNQIMWLPGLSSQGNSDADTRESKVIVDEFGEYKSVKQV